MPHIPNMKEKTLRYPGHVEYIRVLKESGFFDQKSIEINGISLSPLEFTSKILFNEWCLGETEEELTIMRISILGVDSDEKTVEIIYYLYDVYDETTQTSSMARTTGYTATAAANLIIENIFIEKGVFPPELVGKHEACFQFVINYLKDRNINYIKESTIKNG
jgi:saccharopine dehydrogenase-like NADP-dependent oxidoreductase